MSANFRIGTTSYIVEADLVTNARYLAGRVADMQLVLFELADGPTNFPPPATVAELAAIGQGEGLGYSVHLPLDITLAADGSSRHRSLEQAERVIAATAPLAPAAYVLHLAAGWWLAADWGPAGLVRWRDNAWAALELLASWCGDISLLAVENVEGFPLDYLDPVLANPAVRRCIDIGHLLLDGHEPAPYLARYLPRTDVIHIHGLNGRDHHSLACLPPAQLDASLAQLLTAGYEGLLTMEIFGMVDFTSSLDALNASLARLGEADVP